MPENKRLNYFNGQFLLEGDFQEEQSYHLNLQRDHARFFHTPGIVEGLDIQDPAVGATSVTVLSGVAYDGEGRRIVLSANKTVDLGGLGAGRPVYITVSYLESGTDPKPDPTGTPHNTRTLESAQIDKSESAPNDRSMQLVVAKVYTAAAGGILVIDRSERLHAGSKGGDFTANSLTLSSDSMLQSDWATMRLSAAREASLDANLRVNGTIMGTLAWGMVSTEQLAPLSVGTFQLADGAVTQAKLAPLSVGTFQLADGAVTQAKLAPNSVGWAQLVDGSVVGSKLTDLSVTTSKLSDFSVTTAKIDALAVGTAKLADLAVTTAKLADASVTGAKVLDDSIPLLKLKHYLRFDQTSTLNPGQEWGATSTVYSDGGGVFLVQVYTVSPPGTEVTWRESLIPFGSGSGIYQRVFYFKNPSTTTAISFACRIYEIFLS